MLGWMDGGERRGGREGKEKSAGGGGIDVEEKLCKKVGSCVCCECGFVGRRWGEVRKGGDVGVREEESG